jgi:hypothetical protein
VVLGHMSSHLAARAWGCVPKKRPAVDEWHRAQQVDLPDNYSTGSSVRGRLGGTRQCVERLK